MEYQRKFICKTEDDTDKLAIAFAKIVKKGDIFALFGTLGAGKSTFSRKFIQFLTGAQEVPSPTFTLVQMYDADEFEIYHYDMYRLKQPDDAYELGIEEAFVEGVNLIEWPEKIGYLLPKNIWKFNITVAGDCRTFEVTVYSDEKAKRLESVAYE